MLACGFDVCVGVGSLCVDMEFVPTFLTNGNVVSRGVVGVVITLLLQRRQLLLCFSQLVLGGMGLCLSYRGMRFFITSAGVNSPCIFPVWDLFDYIVKHLQLSVQGQPRPLPCTYYWPKPPAVYSLFSLSEWFQALRLCHHVANWHFCCPGRRKVTPPTNS